MDRQRVILEKEIKDAQEKKNNIYSAFVDESKIGREGTKDFFFKLALLCGGVISLSVTYIGYLVSIKDYVIGYPEFLLAGWFFLLICVFASTYRNRSYSFFVHWQLQKRYVECRLEEEEIVQKHMKQYPESYINVEREGDIEKMLRISTQRIKQYKEAIAQNARKEERTNWWWISLERIANITFIAGLFFIILFAAFNLPHVRYQLSQDILYFIQHVNVEK